MAEYADAAANHPEDHARLYAAIEKAYVDDRWPEVLEQGRALLTSLEADDLELRQRLQLLMAHTHLYGYGDRNAAEDLYRAVLASKAGPSLRQIADQGLQQCNLPLQREPQTAPNEQPSASVMPATTPTANLEQLPQPVADPLEDGDGPSLRESLEALGMAMDGTTTTVQPVMPWLMKEPEQPSAPPAEESTSSLIPDVIEEPELIEVHQADPSLVEEYELTETRTMADPSALKISKEEGIPALDPGFEEDPELLQGMLRVVIN
jgi:hypothetical protein